MAEAMPVMPLRPKAKRWSIKTKFLLASLALALAPLILFVAITRSVMVDLRQDVEAALVRHAHGDIGLLDRNQAVIASAMLEKVEAETQMAAFYAEALLRDPGAFGQTRPDSANQKLGDNASKYVLAPGVSLASAQPDLDLISKLQGLFDLVAKDDPTLAEIFVGTQSGVFRVHPWKDTGLYVPKLDFTVDPALAPPPSEEGEIPAPLWQAFKQNGLALSPHVMVKTIDPDNQWAVSDDEGQKIISLRREKTGLAVYSAYDPRIRPWYRRAIGRGGVVWTIYRDFGGGKYLFSLAKELEVQIGDQVSAGLAREFAQRKISLVQKGKISRRDGDKWELQDRDGNNYEIRAVNGQLNVYDLDLLTCSRQVLDPHGRLAGVVGLDVNMDSIRSTVIHTPDEIEAHAFLLNDKGELIDQERPDMFIPAAGGVIRLKMTAGKVGDDYDAATATDVFYAPIRSIHSPDGNSFWSLGISMSDAEITRMADPIRKKMLLILEMIVSVGAVIVILVIGAARRMANGITGPIEGLRAGVMRIGGGDLNYRLDVRTNDEIEDLANAFNKMVCDLQSYVRDLKKTTAEKERFASELQVAHDIQMSFLKKIFPAFPHRSDFSLCATIKTAREVGGDLYDFSLLDDDRLVFYIGDVSDKGVPASLIMAITMTLMKRASTQPGITPAGILKQVNVTLAEDNANSMFVTLFIGILNVKTGELAFSNAGHNPPLILGADGECKFLTLPEGLVLGVAPEAEYRDEAIRLEPGAMIVTYTDGVTEAMNPERQLYSESRLQETSRRLAGCAVEDTVGAIVSSVKAYADGAPQSDDIAVLALRRN